MHTVLDVVRARREHESAGLIEQTAKSCDSTPPHRNVFTKTVRNFVDNCCVSRVFEAPLGFPAMPVL